MPINLEELPQELKEAARTGNLVPFVGAGLSRFAKTSEGRAFPTWNEFLAELVDVAEKGGEITSDEKNEITTLVSRGKFLMAAQAIKSAIPSELFEMHVHKRFSPSDAEPGAIQKSIFRLQPSLVVTTNYDTLLEDAYASVFGRTCEVATYEDVNRVFQVLKGERRDRPVVFKLHGSASFPSRVVFSELDYRKLDYEVPGYRHVLSAVFVTRVVLMLGLSVSGLELSNIVEALRDSFQHRSRPHYIVLQKGITGSIEKKRLRADFGLEVIEYEPTEGQVELLELVNYLASLIEANTKSVDNPLPSHNSI